MTGPGSSPLLSALENAGGVSASYHGRTLIRHFGDPSAEYEAATTGAAVFDRSHRGRLAVTGHAPGQMLNGILTGTLPVAPTEASDGTWAGQATYHAVLTPKGKMISDLWVSLLGDEETRGYLLDLPVAGHAALVEHLGKVLPPRFAAVEDVSGRTAMVSVVGPEAGPLISGLALGNRVSPEDLSSMPEGEWRAAGPPALSAVVMRTGEVGQPAYSVFGPAETVGGLWAELRDEGAVPAGLGVWSTLRVEHGRPVFGTDMDQDTIPTEAGIEDRAIDATKGCYTGQEVIVRIRDRGHVNRRLTRLDLGDVPTPARGAELLASDGSGKVVGHVTSAVQSPATGGVVALAYVRSGHGTVTLGGREVTVPT